MVELRFACEQALVEAICDALEDTGALSVSVDDADAGTDSEQALFGEPGVAPPAEAWVHSRIAALFENEVVAHGAWQSVRVMLADPTATATVQPVPEQDWVRQTQAQFQPVDITPNFWIVPSWHEPPPQAERVLRLDPGLAFGTGTHPTTRMCLRWIAERATQDGGLGRVLDYGCGSGVLAIAAAMHGASEVVAVDVDADAIRATRDNARANGYPNIVTGSPEIAVEYFDIVLANILATPLKVLAPLLTARLAAGASLVLAGILQRQVDEMREVYAPLCPLQLADTEDGWVLLTGKR